MLVVIVSDGASRSPHVAWEIEEFSRTERMVIPIDFGGALARARWLPLVKGLPIAEETNAAALVVGKPSLGVVSRIENSARFARRNRRLRRLSWLSLAIFAVLAILSAIAVRGSVRALQAAAAARGDAAAAKSRAEDARRMAAEKTAIAKKAERDALEAVGREGLARREATQQQQLANSARAKAEAEQNLAAARELSNRAESVRGLSSEGLLQSTVLALRSITVRPTMEGDVALRRGLALLARPRASETLEGVGSIAFSTDGSCMVAETADGRLAVRNVTSSATLGSIQATGRYLAISGDCKVVAIAAGERVRVFDAVSSEERASFQAVEPGDLVGPLALSSNGRYLALVDRTEHMDVGPSILDLETRVPVFNAPAQGQISNVTFSGDDKYVAAGGSVRQFRGFARVWRIDRPEPQGTLDEQLRLHQVGQLDAIALDGVARTLAIAAGGTVAVWKRFEAVDAYREMARLPAGGGRAPTVQALAFSAAGDALVIARSTPNTADKQPTGRLVEHWEAAGYRSAVQRDFDDRLHFLSFRDGTRLQIVGESYARDRAPVRTWDVASGAVTLHKLRQNMTVARFDPIAPGGDVVAMTRNTGTDICRIDRSEAWRTLATDPLWEQRALAVSDNGTVVAVSARYTASKHDTPDTRPTIVRVYRLTESIELAASIDAKTPISEVKLTPDGRRLIVADDTGRVRAWELGAGTEVRLESSAPIRFAFLAVSPRNGYVLASQRAFSAPTFSARIKLWNPSTGRLRAELAESGPITAAAFDHDERLLAVADGWGTVHVWDLESVTRVARLEGHFGVAALAISTDRRFLAVASVGDSGVWPGLVQIYSLDRADLMREACGRLPLVFGTQAACYETR